MTVAVSVYIGGVWIDGGKPRSVILTTPSISSENGEVTSGTLELVMGNQDRKWDPDYVTSPLYGLTVGIPIRAIESTTGTQIFRGTIDELTMHHPGTKNATTEVTSLDLNEQLHIALPSAVEYWNKTLRGGLESCHLPLDDPERGVPLMLVRNTATPSKPGALYLLPRNEESMVPGGGKGGRSWSTPGSVVYLPIPISRAASGDYGISIWFALEAIATGNVIIMNSVNPFVGTDSSGRFQIRVNAGVINFATSGTGGLLTQQIASTASFADGNLHHLYITADAGVGAGIYVDGVQLVPSVNTNPTAIKAPPIGEQFYVGYDPAAAKGIRVTLAHMCFHHTGYAHVEMYRAGAYGAVRADAAAVGITYDTPPKRITWIYQQAGITLGSIVGGTVLIGPMGGSISAHTGLSEAAFSERGLAWVDATGAGRYMLPSATVALTLTEQMILGEIVTKRSRARQVTDVKVAGVSGIEAFASTGGNPKRELELKTILTGTADAQALATATLTARQAVTTGVEKVKYMPVVAGLAAATLALNPGSVVRITYTPAKLGASVTLDTPMEKAVHTWLPGQPWTTELTLGKL